MIDTLRLSLNETLIKDNAELNIIQGDIEMSSGLNMEHDLFVTESGEIIRGKKAYLNTDLYNLTILSKQDADFKFEDEKKYKFQTKYGFYRFKHIPAKINNRTNAKIFLQTSLPKINNYLKGENNYNLNAVTPEEIPGIIKFLYDDLSSKGIVTDFDGSEISRMDIFNNVKTENKYLDYTQVFNQLNFSRKRNLNFGGETFLYYNKSSELCIYDKTEELKKKDIKIEDHTMRFENRYLTKKSFFNKFKVSSSQSLINFPEYKKELINIGNEIFDKKKIEVNMIDENNLRMMLMQFKENRRFWIRDFFYHEGMISVLNNVDKNILLLILKDLMKKDLFCRFKKEIDSFNFSKSIFNNIKTINLFDELKEKYFENLNKVA